MPLPLINPQTLEPTGEFLPVLDYFNPTRNPNFSRDFPSGHRFLRNYVNMNDIRKVGQVLAHPDALEELIPYILQQYTSSHQTMYCRDFLRLVYESLPEDNKFLIFFTGFTTGNSINNGHSFSVRIRVPSSVAHNEIYMQTVSVPPPTTTSDLVSYLPTEAQKEAFRNSLTAQLPAILEFFNNISPNSNIYMFDGSFPRVIKQTLLYLADRELFSPDGEMDDCSIPFDNYCPSALFNFITHGTRITFAVNRTFSRLSYRASYAASDRSRLGRVMNYSTNVLSVLPYTIKGPKEAAAPTYGVELESCSDYTPREMIDAQKDLFFIMKQDNSISGSKPQKYEIVTVPASLKAHKRLWAELFEKIDYNKFDTTKNTGNGMHVHIGRKSFTSAHLNRFTWFITNPANFDFMFAVSERPNKNDLSRWAAMPDYSRHNNKHSAALSSYDSAMHLRGSVHYKGNVTVEVRMFKGIVSYATIIKNLEFVDSVFHFTQSTGLSQLTLKNYLAWLEATPKNRYHTLKTFIAETPVKDFITAAEVQDYLWMETKDFVITEKLNKAPFKVTNSHITLLNKKRRMRSFILKNGEVICIRNNGGLLAKLDKSLSKKQTRGAATFTMTEIAAA